MVHFRRARSGAARGWIPRAEAKFFLLRFDPATRAARLVALPMPPAEAARYTGWPPSRCLPMAASSPWLRRARPSPLTPGDQGLQPWPPGQQRTGRGREKAGSAAAGNHRAAALLGGQRADTRVPARGRVSRHRQGPPARHRRARRQPAVGSKPAMTLRKSPASDVGNTLITPDGTKIVAARFTHGTAKSGPGRTEISASSPHATGRVRARPGPVAVQCRRPAPEPGKELDLDKYLRPHPDRRRPAGHGTRLGTGSATRLGLSSAS